MSPKHSVVVAYEAYRERVERQREESVNSERLGRQLKAFNDMNAGRPFVRSDLFLEDLGV